jgi:Protein of unknown function (DUF4231)
MAGFLNWIRNPLLEWPGTPVWYEKLPQDAMDANTKSYISERLIPFTQKLFKKATREMRLYFAFQIIIIVFSALIPIVNVVPAPNKEDTIVRILSTVFGSIIVVTTGFLQLSKAREAAIIFRIITSRIQREYHSFIKKVDDYSPEKMKGKGNPEKFFIHNMESLIFNATTEYYSLFRESKEQDIQTGEPAADSTNI